MSRISWMFAALGVLFGAAAAIFIRLAGFALFHQGGYWLIGLFLATPFAGWILIKTCLAVTGVPEDEALSPVAILCTTSLLLHGIVVSQYSWVYGESIEQVLLGAAWLLWGLGALMALAIYLELRAGA